MPWLLAHFGRVEKRLRSRLRRDGRSREDSEDLIQEAMLRLHEYCRSNHVDNQEAFLLRTVRNLSIDRHRSEQGHLFADRPVEELEAAVSIADEGPSADEILAAQERLYRISNTLAAISPRTRDIYFAHRAGYSYAEIGEHLGVSKSTIEKHIARGVQALMDEKDPQ